MSIREHLVYTALSGNRDLPRNDIPMYGERKLFIKDVLNAKIYKMLPHLFFPDYKSYMWVDANIFLVEKEEYYFEKYLNGYDMAIFKHPWRSTIAEELSELRKTNYYHLIPEVEEQVKTYGDITGLYEANMIMRLNNDKMNTVFERWWSHVCRWQYRDQISLPFVLSEDISINVLTGNIRKHSEFIYKEHVT